MKYRETRIEVPKNARLREPEGESDPLAGYGRRFRRISPGNKDPYRVTKLIRIGVADEWVFWDDRQGIQQYGSVRREAVEPHETCVQRGTMKVQV
jgi:hypothetical protein